MVLQVVKILHLVFFSNTNYPSNRYICDCLDYNSHVADKKKK